MSIKSFLKYNVIVLLTSIAIILMYETPETWDNTLVFGLVGLYIGILITIEDKNKNKENEKEINT